MLIRFRPSFSRSVFIFCGVTSEKLSLYDIGNCPPVCPFAVVVSLAQLLIFEVNICVYVSCWNVHLNTS